MARKKPKNPKSNDLVVTSVRVHPKVIEHARGLCGKAGLNFNQFLILCAASLEEDRGWKNLVKAERARRRALAKMMPRIKQLQAARCVTPVQEELTAEDVEGRACLAALAEPHLASRKQKK